MLATPVCAASAAGDPPLNQAPAAPSPAHRGATQLLARSWRGWVWRLCTRASAACAVLHLVKLAAKRAARGRRRAAAAVDFVCDVLLPTGFYGPAAGITLEVVQQVRALRGSEERDE